MDSMHRHGIRTRAAALLALCLCLGSSALSYSNKDLIQPVPLQDVQLKHNSQFDKAVSLNTEYILGIDSDRLLKTFRLNAGLDAPGENFGGSWEDPSCEVRGQFMGHWLSGTAMLARNTGDKAILEKAGSIIKELRKVQEALGGGYLSAFPREHFDRLRALQQVWAPFYVIHKIMAGLLDHYTFLGNELALQMVVDEATFFLGYIEDVMGNEGKDHWLQMLEVEYGGMEELLFNLFAATSDIKWANMAKLFTKPNFYELLTQKVDTLPGRHANTHLAQVNGFAAGFESTGDEGRLSAVANFFDIVTNAHTYATGGNNDGEYWQAPRELASSIAAEGAGRNTEETCTTYNMMKIARYLFRWSGDARFADYYERAILNGMLGTQRMPADYVSKNGLPSGANTTGSSRRLLQDSPQETNPKLPAQPANHSLATAVHANAVHPRSLDWRQQAFAMFDANQNLPEWSNAPGPGVIIYLLPLGAGNTKDDNWHHWSTPLNSFWCCSGSIAESFGKLMDSIYFHREVKGSPPELYINQLTPSILKWRAGKLDVSLDADLHSPDNVARASIKLEPFDGPSADGKAKATLKLRIPAWAVVAGSSVTLNDGEVVAADADLKPGSYLALHREFKSGDEIKLQLRMRVTTEQINDHRPEFSNLRAVLVGPFLMAALTEKSRDIRADPASIEALLRNVSSEGLATLETPGGSVLHSRHGEVSLQPKERCLPAMDCTFRTLQKRRLANGTALEPLSAWAADQEVVLESMAFPGHFVSAGSQGELTMQHLPAAEAQTWVSRASGTGNGAVTLQHGLQPGDFIAVANRNSSTDIAVTDLAAQGLRVIEFFVRAPLGSYPEGAKLLEGDDVSYVIAPLGNLIEERYTPYLQFNQGAASLARPALSIS